MPLAHRYALYRRRPVPGRNKAAAGSVAAPKRAPPLSASPACPPPRRNGRARRATTACTPRSSPLPPDRRRRAVECGPGRRRAGGSAQRLRHRTGMRAPARPGDDRATRRAAHAFTRWPTPPCANWIAARPAHARGTGQTPAPSAGAGPARAAGALGLPYVFDQFTFHITLSENWRTPSCAGAGLHRPLRRSARRPAHARRRRQRHVQPGPGEDFWPRAITVSTAARGCGRRGLYAGEAAA